MRLLTAVVAAVGWAIAAYLTLVHYTDGEAACVIAEGCTVVQSSEYAKLAGVPVALLGLVSYSAILGAQMRDTDTSRTVAALTAFVGTGFSGWLTYVEVVELEAICAWCVGSAVCMAALAVLSARRMLRAGSGVDPRHLSKQGGVACTSDSERC